MWVCGQVWVIYGYIMVYCEIYDVCFLDFVWKVLDVYLFCIFEDMIFYWDFNVLELFLGELKDVLVVVIMVFVLLEFFIYINNSDFVFFYWNKVVEMFQILFFLVYQVCNKKDVFLLYLVGYMNKGWEVDVFISYVDYYYLEVLV